MSEKARKADPNERPAAASSQRTLPYSSRREVSRQRGRPIAGPGGHVVLKNVGVEVMDPICSRRFWSGNALLVARP